MSDRAIAEMRFNEYKSAILQSVVHNWENITTEEQQSIAQMFNFFCGMHLVVNMAEHVSESVNLFEQDYLRVSYPMIVAVAQSGSSEHVARPLK